jgi:hypothetical protein
MGKKVFVNDLMQKGYSYELSEPVGKNFHEGFFPDLTPKEMLSMGVFGGKYMNDCKDEFPKDWFVKAKMSKVKDVSLNFFEIDASQSLKVWRENGWIHPDDPRGWFQWYCRYFMGRRHEDDPRQIGRWKKMRRHAGQIKANCSKGDLACRRRQRQALLHWGYDSRKI